MSRTLRIGFLCAATLIAALFLFGSTANAHMGAERFKIEKRVSVPPKGPRGQLELRSSSGGEVRLLRAEGTDYVGSFDVRNTGPGPLTITRVFVLDADDDQRSPPGLSAQPEGGARASIPPGQSRHYDVTWHAGEARARQLFAQIVVDSDAAQPEAKQVDPPKTVGVVADRRTGLERHGLSLLLGLPLLLALAALASRFVAPLRGKVLRSFGSGLMLVEAALAVLLFSGFDRELGKRDGNDGLQLIERAIVDRASGLELFLGVDGLSMAAILVVAVVGLAAVVALDPGSDSPRPLGGAALLVSGAVAALSTQTTMGFVAAWVVLVGGAVLLTWDSARSASLQIAIVGVVSTALLTVGLRFIASHAGGASLVDGSETSMVYAFPDLVRAHFSTELTPWLGLPGYRSAWLLVFLGSAAFLPIVPLHGWLSALGTRGSTFHPSSSGRSLAETALAAAILPLVSAYAVLRLALVIQPDGARWGAESLPTVGVVFLVIGGLFASTERDLGRIGAHLSLARGGLFLLLAFSLTPQGIEAAAGLAAAFGIASALFHLATGRATARAHESALARLSGIGRSAPILSTALIVGILGLASPLLPGMLGPLVGLVGAMGRNPFSAVAGTAALGLSMIGVARAVRTVFGSPPSEWRDSKYLEPFGGTVPDLRRGDLAWAAPLFALALLAMLAPRLFVGPVDSIIRDLVPRLDPDGPTRVALDIERPSATEPGARS